jgi:hypothetical protein
MRNPGMQEKTEFETGIVPAFLHSCIPYGNSSVLVTAVASRLVAETDREMYLSLLTDRASKAGVTPEMAFEFS